MGSLTCDSCGAVLEAAASILAAARCGGFSLAAGDKLQSHGAVLVHRGQGVARSSAPPAADRQDWASPALEAGARRNS